MMKTFSLPIGKGTQTVSLDEAHVLYDLHGNPVDAVADEQEAIRQALRHPIGSAPLKDVVQAGDTVAIIVSDITRLVHTAQMLPVIVDELNQAASGTNRLPSSRPRGRTGPIRRKKTSPSAAKTWSSASKSSATTAAMRRS